MDKPIKVNVDGKIHTVIFGIQDQYEFFECQDCDELFAKIGEARAPECHKAVA
jgi:hypothetical protein